MKRFSKLLVLALSLALVLGSMIGLSVTASATEGDAPTVSIAGKNMSYTGAVQVMYYVEATNADLETDVRLLVSDAAIDLSNKANLSELDSSVSVKIYRGEATVNKGNGQVTYGIFFSDAIAPAELRKPIHAIPVVVDETGAIKATGTPSVYSPYQYAVNRFAADGVTAPQIALYKALLDYGAAVQAVLYDENEIKTTLGGWADAYYNITVKSAVDGVLQNNAQIAEKAYRPSDVIKAKNYLDTDEIFIGYTKEDGTTPLIDEGKTFASLLLTGSTVKTPGNSVVVANYTTKLGAYETFDNFDTSKYVSSGMAIVADPTTAAKGYASLVTSKGNTAFEVGNNDMLHDEADNHSNGSATIKLLNRDQEDYPFKKGEVFVLDTDITFDTNMIRTGTSGPDWPVKIFLCSTDTNDDAAEIMNLTFSTNDAQNVTVNRASGTKTETVKSTYNLRIVFIPDYKCFVYVDGVLTNTHSVTGFSMEAGETKPAQLQTFGCLAISMRGSKYLTNAAPNGEATKIYAKLTFDNLYFGAQSHAYYESSINTCDFESGISNGVVAGSSTIKTEEGNSYLNATGGTVSFTTAQYATFVPKDAVYFFETDFTYDGGKPKAVMTTDDKAGIAFVGFINTNKTAQWNSGMYKWGYMKYATDSSGNYLLDDEDYVEYVTLFGQKYYRGDTVRIRYEYVVGTGAMRIYHEGNLVSQTYNDDGSLKSEAFSGWNATGKGTEMSIFGFEYGIRGGGKGAEFSMSFDNTSVGFIYPEYEQTITLDTNGGTTEKPTSISIAYGETLTPPTESEVKKGFTENEVEYPSTFLGWYIGSTKIESGIWYGIAKETTLTAMWTDYKAVNFTTQEGTAPSKIYLKYGEAYELLEPTGAESNFLGWYYGDTKIENSGTWAYDQEITLEARWDTTYNVTFNAGEGASFIGVAPSFKIAKGDAYGPDVDGKALPTADKLNAPTGKVFLGWYVGLKRVSESGNWLYEEDIELTAKWGKAVDVFADYTSTTSHKGFFRSAENFAQTYTAGTKYVINFTFTYMGGSPKADGTNPTKAGDGAAFFTITNSTASGSTRIVYDYPYYTGELITVGDKSFYKNCVFSKLEFEYGVTYHLRLEYVVGDKSQTKIHVLDDKGNIVKSGFYSYTNNNSVSSGGVDDTKFGGFYIERRAAKVGANEFNYVMEDISIVVEDASAT